MRFSGQQMVVASTDEAKEKIIPPSDAVLGPGAIDS